MNLATHSPALSRGSVAALALLIAGAALAGACKAKQDPPANKADEPTATTVTAVVAHDAATEPSDAAVLTLPPAPPLAQRPIGLPKTPSPAHNVTNADKVSLGELLFFDPRLSGGEMACASCHQPERGWSSGESLDTTAAQQLNKRHTPSLWNLAYHDAFYWDGRATPMESQILGHWQGQLDSDPDERCTELAANPVYQAHFNRAFAGELNPNRAAEALAAFVRNQRYAGSAWDRYEAGERDAVSEQVIAGAKIFNVRAGCATCHAPPLYTDLRYHRLIALSDSDPGRAGVTRRPEDHAAFKTPGLRGLVYSAPYFHDGSAASLEEVLDRKVASGSPTLTPEERAALLAFLAALSEAPTTLVPTLP